MPKLPTLIAAAALALLSLPVAAAPIELHSSALHQDTQLNGPFTHVFAPFELQQASLLAFTLTGFTESGDSSDLLIQRVVLSQGLQEFVFEADRLQHVADRCLNLFEQTCGPDDFKNWYRDYQLADVQLGAGAWTLTVVGEDGDNKLWTEYSLKAQAQSVPEPWSLALVLGALAPALVLRRRQAR